MHMGPWVWLRVWIGDWSRTRGRRLGGGGRDGNGMRPVPGVGRDGPVEGADVHGARESERGGVKGDVGLEDGVDDEGRVGGEDVPSERGEDEAARSRVLATIFHGDKI